MSNVIDLFQNQDAATALRNIADAIDAGEFNGDSLTLITVPDVFQIGTFENNDAITETLFNCQYAIHKLMTAAMDINS